MTLLSRFLVLSSIIILASFSTIVLLIAPKAYRMRHGPKGVVFTTEKTDSLRGPSRLNEDMHGSGRPPTTLEEKDTGFIEAQKKSIGAAKQFGKELKEKESGKEIKEI